MIDINYIPEKNLINYLINDLKNHKLYDIDWSELIQTNDNNINDLLQCSPNYHATQTKKFSENKKLISTNIGLLESYVLGKSEEDEEITTQQKRQKTNTKDEESNTPRNISETLKTKLLADIAIDIDDNFLLEESSDNELDLPNIESIYEEEEDFLSDISTYTRPKYLQKELLQIGGFDTKLSDIFITKPEKQQKQFNTGSVNFLIKRVQESSPIIIKQIYYKYDVTDLYRYNTMWNFITNLSHINNLFNFEKGKMKKKEKHFKNLFSIACSSDFNFNYF